MKWFGKKKAPEPKKPISFMPEECTDKINIIFDSTGIERLFKQVYPDFKYILVKNKEENRLQVMADSIVDQTELLHRYQHSAINAFASSNNAQERLLGEIGFIKMKAKGLNICLGCLRRTILTYEENLQTLKDLEETVNRVAK